MAKSMIRNKLGEKTYTFYVPANDTVANDFATAILEGEYEILSSVGVTGNQTVTGGYKMATVLIQDNAGQKLYLRFAVPNGKSEEDIYTALLGKTYNGVKAEKLYVVGLRSVA